MKKYFFRIFIFLPTFCIFAAPFSDNSNGTVKDQKTNLVWQKCSIGLSGSSCEVGSANTLTWATALNSCNNLSLASRTWRLPSVAELLTLSDESKMNPSINKTAFPATASDGYWSSTTYAANGNAWSVYFSTGSSSAGDSKSGLHYARCVSTGP